MDKSRKKLRRMVNLIPAPSLYYVIPAKAGIQFA